MGKWMEQALHKLLHYMGIRPNQLMLIILIHFHTATVLALFIKTRFGAKA